MAWPSTPTTTGSGFGSGSGTSIATSGSVAVTAGDLIYVSVCWEGADSVITCSDGGVNTYTQVFGSNLNNGTGNPEPWNQCFRAVAATTTSVTITASYGGGADSRTFRTITVLVFHPDAAGTISLDGTPAGTGGISASIATGNVTTSTQAANCGLAITSYAFYGDDPSSEQINGTAADNITTNNGAEVWMLRYTNGFTGQGAATIGFNNWSAGLATFKIEPVAVAATPIPFVGSFGRSGGRPHRRYPL